MAEVSYSAQQVLRLCAHVHKAFLQKDARKLRELVRPVLQNVHLLRPGEFAMMLNHYANGRVVDKPFWNQMAESVEDVFVDPDCRSLGISVNAFARASFRHDGTLDIIAKWGERLANSEEIDAKNIALMVNGYAKLRVRNDSFMGVMVGEVAKRASELNHVDIANIANGYARLGIRSERLFDSLRGPVIQNMNNFSMVNLSTLADAYARLQLHDMTVLDALAAELNSRCKKGNLVPANCLPAIISAYVEKLNVHTLDTIQVIESSLPKAMKDMGKNDIILSVPPLIRLDALCPSGEFLDQVFSACRKIMPDITCNAVIGLLSVAEHWQYDRQDFWDSSLKVCAGKIAFGEWEPRYVSMAAGIAGKLCATSGKYARSQPVVSTSVQDELFESFQGELERSPQAYDLRSVADIAVACLRAEPANDRNLQALLVERSKSLPRESTSAWSSGESASERRDQLRLQGALEGLRERTKSFDAP